MAPRKTTSKQAISGAPVSPPEMEPLARTTSGRQRRPTEKASYQGKLLLRRCILLTCDMASLQGWNCNRSSTVKQESKKS